MRKLLVLGVVMLTAPALLPAQERLRDRPYIGSVDLGVNGVGLSLGNSIRWTGLRINLRDRYVERVNGINLTLWTGFQAAGLGLVAQGELVGINIGGLGVVAQGSMSGINISGLGTVAQGSMTGINISGLGTVAQGNMTGINIAGLGAVAQGDLTGITIAGIGTVAQGDMRWINLAGIGSIRGLAITLGGLESEHDIRGIVGAGYRIKAPDVRGLAASIAMMRVHDFRGFAVGAYNEVNGTQRGLTIGIYNTARELHGLQIGLLNHAENNRPPFRWLPIINAHF
jgi:hypothetical protein